MTPAAIWDLPFTDWLIFAIGSDEYQAEQRKRSKG